METDDIAEEGLNMLAEGVDVKRIISMIDRKMKKAMYKSHQRIKPNKPAQILEDEAIFWTLTNNLEKEVRKLDDMNVDHKIFNISMKKMI